MPKAIQVREDNIAYIEKYARDRGFFLDYLRDNMVYAKTEFGWNTYLITDGTLEDRNVTFTEFAEPDFRILWKFVEQENPNHFVKIERV